MTTVKDKKEKSPQKKFNFNIRNFLLYLAPIIVIAISTIVIAFYLPSIFAEQIEKAGSPGFVPVPQITPKDIPIIPKTDEERYVKDFLNSRQEIDKFTEQLQKPGLIADIDLARNVAENYKVSAENVLMILAKSGYDKTKWDKLYRDYSESIVDASEEFENINQPKMNYSRIDYDELKKGGEAAQSEFQKVKTDQETEAKRVQNAQKSDKSKDFFDCNVECVRIKSVGSMINQLMNPVCYMICGVSNAYVNFLWWINSIFEGLNI